MQKPQMFVDVTQQLVAYSKKLHLLEAINDVGYTLQQSMQAHEINDPKIDPKYDIKKQYSIKWQLQNNKIKLPNTLNIRQMRIIFKNILISQAQILKGMPLAQTIYKFTYLFDKSICEKHKIMSTLIQSINSCGSYIYEIVKQSCLTKQDDIGLTSYSLSTKSLPNQEIIQQFIKMQKELELQMKNSQTDKKQYAQLLSNIRIRRSIHAFIKQLGFKYDNKNYQKIINAITNIKKRIQQFQKSILVQENQTVEGIFSDTMYKTLRAHFSPRQVQQIKIKDAIQILKETLRQFQLFFPLPLKFVQWRNAVETLQLSPLNLWSKSYVKINMFAKEGLIFNTVNMQQSLISDINDWVTLKQGIIKDQKFQEFIKQATGIVGETIYRLLGNQLRWFWQCSKIYEDFNYIIYMANDYDSHLSDKKQLCVSSWFYYYGLNLMIKQISVGFKTYIYEPHEYPYVLCFMESLLSIFDRNSQIFLKKMDKLYITSFLQGNLIHKKKKKVQTNIRKQFTQTQFKKALYMYVHSIYRILVILQHRKHIIDPFQDKLELKIQNRFRIFKNIAFIRQLNYEEYMKSRENIISNEKSVLDEILQLLKQAKSLFQTITQLEDTDTYVGQRQQAELLMKSCVQNSLVVMTLKMNQPKKYKVCQGVTNYPEIKIV